LSALPKRSDTEWPGDLRPTVTTPRRDIPVISNVKTDDPLTPLVKLIERASVVVDEALNEPEVTPRTGSEKATVKCSEAALDGEDVPPETKMPDVDGGVVSAAATPVCTGSQRPARKRRTNQKAS
jgi:hypothetical protein